MSAPGRCSSGRHAGRGPTHGRSPQRPVAQRGPSCETARPIEMGGEVLVADPEPCRQAITSERAERRKALLDESPSTAGIDAPASVYVTVSRSGLIERPRELEVVAGVDDWRRSTQVARPARARQGSGRRPRHHRAPRSSSRRLAALAPCWARGADEFAHAVLEGGPRAPVEMDRGAGGNRGSSRDGSPSGHGANRGRPVAPIAVAAISTTRSSGVGLPVRCSSVVPIRASRPG